MSDKVAKNSEKYSLIAIPSIDGITIFPKMLGMANYFFIYSTTDGIQFTLLEKRVNPYETTLQHLKTLDVFDIISDCKIIITAYIGRKGAERLRDRGMKLFFRNGDIQEALKNVFRDEFC